MIGAFAAVYFIWGSTYLAIRRVLETMPPFASASMRFLIAGSLLYAFARSRGAKPLTANQWKWSATLGGLMLFVGNGAVMWAEQRIPSGPAALIVATEPIMIVLFQRIMPSPSVVAGLVLGFAGVVVLVGPGILGGGQPLDPTATLVLIGGSAAWATGSLLGRNADQPADGLLSAASQMLCGGAFLAVLGLAHGDWQQLATSSISLRSLSGLVYLILFGSIVAYTCYGYLVRNAAPSKVATYAFVNPVVAVILGALYGGEMLSGRVVIAGGLIVGAVALMVLTKRRAPA